MPEKQLNEDEADFVNSVLSGIGYAVDTRNAAKASIAAKKTLVAQRNAQRIARQFSNLPRVALQTTKASAKRAPLVGAVIDTALLMHPDTRASVFREIEDDAANANPATRMVKGYLSPIATVAGAANMVSETNEMADKEILEAAEPDSRYVAKKKKAAMIKKARTDDASFAEAVERRLNRQA